MKKHRFNPRFWYKRRCSTDHIHPSAGKQKQVESQPKANGYFWDWTSALHISLRSGMFKHPKVVSITAAKLDPKQQSKEKPILPNRTATLPHIAIRQMLAAAHSHQTQVLQKKLQSRERSVRTRAKILYMPRAAATTAATHSPAVPVAAAEICKETHS
jgi:hypothetical protein